MAASLTEALLWNAISCALGTRRLPMRRPLWIVRLGGRHRIDAFVDRLFAPLDRLLDRRIKKRGAPHFSRPTPNISALNDTNARVGARKPSLDRARAGITQFGSGFKGARSH